MEGGVQDLPDNINIPVGFHGLFQHFVKHTHCGLWSSMHSSTLAELLRRLLLQSVLEGFIFIAGVDKPNKNNPYPNRGDMLKYILSNPQQRKILWNQTLVVLQLDPLKWPYVRLLGPSICVKDEANSFESQCPFYARRVLDVRGEPCKKVD